MTSRLDGWFTHFDDDLSTWILNANAGGLFGGLDLCLYHDLGGRLSGLGGDDRL